MKAADYGRAQRSARPLDRSATWERQDYAFRLLESAAPPPTRRPGRCLPLAPPRRPRPRRRRSRASGRAGRAAPRAPPPVAGLGSGTVGVREGGLLYRGVGEGGLRYRGGGEGGVGVCVCVWNCLQTASLTRSSLVVLTRVRSRCCVPPAASRDPPARPASSSGRAPRSCRTRREVDGCGSHVTRIWSGSSLGRAAPQPNDGGAEAARGDSRRRADCPTSGQAPHAPGVCTEDMLARGRGIAARGARETAGRGCLQPVQAGVTKVSARPWRVLARTQAPLTADWHGLAPQKAPQ